MSKMNIDRWNPEGDWKDVSEGESTSDESEEENEGGETDDLSDSSLDSDDLDALAGGDLDDFAVMDFSHPIQKRSGAGQLRIITNPSREQPPKGLSGKALGMWFKDRSKREKSSQKMDKLKKKMLKKDDKKNRDTPRTFPGIFMQKNFIEKLEKGLRAYEQSEKLRKETERSRVVQHHDAPEAELEAITETLGWNEDEEYAYMEIIDPAMPGVARVNIRSSMAERRMETISQKLLEEFEAKQKNSAYLEMLRQRKRLPSFASREALIKTIEESQVVVVSGETGCGKTTQLPQFILDDWITKGKGGKCNIVCTQPRRISAISVAERIAKERAEKLGESVGYQIRLEKQLPREEGSILLCTTGVLLQWLNSNKNLTGVSHIIVDEIHEQDILSDFLLIVLKTILLSRPDLRVILMSATINAEKFSAYFGGCPLINIPGFTFEVQEYFLEHLIPMLRYRPNEKGEKKRHNQMHTSPGWNEFLSSPGMARTTRDILEKYDDSELDFDLIVEIVRHIVKSSDQSEAILIFLPGWDDIKKLNTLLQQYLLPQKSYLIIPLHSMMPTINQRAVFDRPDNQRKVVIATSIAETSITIDDIVHVIDCGKIKMKGFDVTRNLSTLAAQWVSVSNARQRRGRAGRVKSGVCYHLYTTFRYNLLEPYPIPEIRRTRLDELCLQLKMLKLGRVAPFVARAMEPPEPKAVEQAIHLLWRIGALDTNEELTPLGELLAKTPIPPQLGKMLYLGCIFRCIEPILDVACVLSYRDPFCTPLGREAEAREIRNRLGNSTDSDHIMFHKTIMDFEQNTQGLRYNQALDYCFENFLFHSTCVQIIKMKKQFAYVLHQAGFLKTPNPNDSYANFNSAHEKSEQIIRAVVFAGLYPNVALMKETKHKHQPIPLTTEHFGLQGQKFFVHPKSIFGHQPSKGGIVAFFSQVQTSKLYIHDISLLGEHNLAAALFCQKIAPQKFQNGQMAKLDGWLDIRLSGHENVKLIERWKSAMEDMLQNLYRDGLFGEFAKRTAVQELVKMVTESFTFRTTTR